MKKKDPLREVIYVKATVMVIGGNGFLGQHLIELIREKFSIWVVDITKGVEQMATFVDCDITNFQEVSKLFAAARPDAVIHLAAITGVERCQLRPYESFLVNVLGTYNVAYMTALHKSRLVFASSREVYGETLQSMTDEVAEMRPNNLYGLTKMLGESIVKWLQASMGLRYVILRFTNLYGPGGDQYAVAAITKRAIEGEDIPVFGGNQVLNLIDARDAARAIEICLIKSEADNEIYNIGTHDTVSVSEVINRIVSLCNSTSKIVPSPMRAGDTKFFHPDLSKARSKLGFEPRIILEQGLVDCVEYYRSRRRGT
jgi:nucleoside-diphosphate-sugar epimerase